MRIQRFFIAAVLMISLAGLSAKSVKNENNEIPISEIVQCGVSNAQISAYLEACSHHHTVYWVQDIPGSCNSKAGIEGCSIATVYVDNGIITGHMDAAGVCD
ncbi:MAG: hypothetical protein SGI96_15205 [Bacteroidota bacterium]|nr:hypothetical protein [Bacteroidota bacterium]